MRAEKAEEFEKLQLKRQDLLEKHNIINGYSTFDAPKDLKTVDSKINTTVDKLDQVVGQLNELEEIQIAADKEFSQTFEIILDGIEQKEFFRLKEIKKGMLEYIEALKQMRVSLFDIEQKFIKDAESFDPKDDIQKYIQNRSLYQEADQIAQLYKDKGMTLKSSTLGFNYVPHGKVQISQVPTMTKARSENIVSQEIEEDLNLDSSEEDQDEPAKTDESHFHPEQASLPICNLCRFLIKKQRRF